MPYEEQRNKADDSCEKRCLECGSVSVSHAVVAGPRVSRRLYVKSFSSSVTELSNPPVFPLKEGVATKLPRASLDFAKYRTDPHGKEVRHNVAACWVQCYLIVKADCGACRTAAATTAEIRDIDFSRSALMALQDLCFAKGTGYLRTSYTPFIPDVS